MEFCFLNGKIIREIDALISIDDIGLLRGYGVFDFLRTYNGKPFLLSDHLVRLKNSAKALSLTVPLNDQEIEALIHKLLKKNSVKEAQIRILLTGGKTVNGMDYDSLHPTFAILIEPLATPAKELYGNGAALITNTHLRPIHTAKTTSYINAISLAAQRKKMAAMEILYLFHDFVLECSTSNFFIFIGDTLITPKDNILLGTTRNFLLKFLKDDFRIEERDIHVNELKQADEAFITAVNKEVLPVVKIDTMVVGSGKVGNNTRKIMDKFSRFTSAY